MQQPFLQLLGGPALCLQSYFKPSEGCPDQTMPQPNLESLQCGNNKLRPPIFGYFHHVLALAPLGNLHFKPCDVTISFGYSFAVFKDIFEAVGGLGSRP